MFCKHCGVTLEENLKFCPACGTAIEEAPAEVTSVAPVAPTPSPRKKTVTADQIPEEYQPLSPWAYFGLQILFSIPIVGFVFLIIFSINGSNLNRRNFARSYWCGLIIVGSILLIVLLFALIFTTGKRVF
ncbi:MAG: zinc ribbon domain-containing protein [Clostridia bacterium]|nr:zinc ribbon domain-containing protein [Clostridia bacterium]